MTSHRHEVGLATHLLVEAGGPAIVVGSRRFDLVQATAAASSVVLCCGSRRDAHLASARADHAYLAAVEVLGTPEDALVDFPDGLAHTLVVGDLSDAGDPVVLVDQLLARVADGGVVVVDVPSGGRHERPLRLMTEALCRDVVEPSWRDPGRLTILARRRAPGSDIDPIDTPEPADVAVIVASRGRPELLHELVADVLLRQAVPPAVFLVCDDAAPGEESIPEDLWGFASRSATQPALLRTGGVGKAAALAQALESVETEYVVIVDDDDRLAPVHVQSLHDALEDDANLVAVASDALVADATLAPLAARTLPAFSSRSALAALLEGCVFLQPTVMMRRSALVECGGVRPDLERLMDWDLWLRLARKGPIGRVAAPLAVIRRHPGNARTQATNDVIAASARRIVTDFRRECPLAEVAAAFTEHPPRMRRALALERRGRAAIRVGAMAEGLEDLRASVAALPDALPPRLSLAWGLRRAGDLDGLRAVGEELLDRFPRAGEARLAAATARALSGDTAGALAILDDLVRGAPRLVTAHLNRLYLEAARTGQDGVGSAVAALVRALDVARLPGADFLLDDEPLRRAPGQGAT